MSKGKVLETTEFGNPILRKVAKRLNKEEILSTKIQGFIADLKATCDANPYGVGLAAPQVGESLAIVAISVKSTPARPELASFEKVVINPEIVEYLGSEVDMWDGCLSSGPLPVFAQTKRYKKIVVSYFDEEGEFHENETLTGFIAHVFQHETDHLNGMLFVDRVVDSKSWMSNAEYIKMRSKR
jgi:peptide deformylase